MTVSADSIAAELRARQPRLEQKKLHKLLFFCQGHHLATFGEPLFRERISAYDHGPVVAKFWHDEKYGQPSPPGAARLDEAQLNTIGYVLSRYGKMSGADLERVTHGQPPWQRADAHRMPGTSAIIEEAWIEEFFRSEPADENEIVLDGTQLAAWLREASSKPEAPDELDSPDALRARLERLRGTAATASRGVE